MHRKHSPNVSARPHSPAAPLPVAPPSAAEIERAAATADRVRDEVDRLLGYPKRRARDLARLDAAMGLAKPSAEPRLLGSKLVFGGAQGGEPVGALRANAALDQAFGITDPHRGRDALATGAA